MIKEKIEYKTFSTKGLSELEISFLAGLEYKFLSGKEVNLKDVYKEIKSHKPKDAAKLLDAFKYWEWIPKPKMYETLNTPINLSELLTKGGGSIYLTESNTHDSWRVSITDKLRAVIVELNMLSGLTTYFEIVNDYLYIKYDHIIGSRCIACIKNDFN